MAVEIRWTAYGEPALAALAAELDRAQGGDPFRAVTVVTPSPAVAVLTRRALARRVGGSMGVSFHSMGALAELVAARHLADAGIEVGIDRELVVAAVRVALRAEPGGLASIRHHRATWESIAETVVEVDALDDAGRARVAAGGALPAEMARVHAAVRDLIGPPGSAAVVRLATTLVREGTVSLDEVGPIVVHLPERPGAVELDLLDALQAVVPVTVLAGATGRPAVDTATAASLPQSASSPPPDVVPAVPTAVVAANDIDDEVRAAVRRLLSRAEAGTPLARMALVHPPGAPYTRIVADVLGAAGIPYSAPSARSLAQTTAGRVLTAMLSVIRSGFARQDVVDLWATGVVVDDDGTVVPAAAFDDATRRFGITRGVDRWHRGIDAADARSQRRRDEAVDDAGAPDEVARERHERDLARNARLRRALALLETVAEDQPRRWPDVGPWCERTLDLLCGPATRRSWPEHELEAETAIRTAVGRLGTLDTVEPDPTGDVVLDTVRTVLDAPAPRLHRTGHGLTVTTFDRPPVVPLDAVAVVGLVEGLAPAVPRDDVLLGPELRRELGLAGPDEHRLDQERAHLATLASASEARILTFPRHDQRSGRSLVPSRWVVDAVEAITGVRPDAEALMAGADVDGVDRVDSYSAGLRAVAAGAVAALDRNELVFADLVDAGGIDGHPAAGEPVLERGAILSRSRAATAFTRFDGNLDGEGIDVTTLGVLSPTSLETYATCPRRWFFSQALRLRAVDRPEEIHRLQPRDKGTLVHAILERFFGEMIASDAVPPPGAAWPVDARSRLATIADEECDELEARGLTGHPRWWEHDRAEIDVALAQALARDVEVREASGAMPVAVEFSFGRDGKPPTEIDLGDGRVVALAGSADRIDLGDDAVTVWDYKYSGSNRFHDLVADEDAGGDPLLGGTKLQLVAYGMAAGERYERSDVRAAYWFLKPDTEREEVGYPVTDELRERFRRVLAVLADGIEGGRFPARPGEYQWHLGTHAHCAWCDFDEICPRDRDEEWERVRFDPSLRRVARLADEGSASVLDEPEPAGDDEAVVPR